MTKKVSRRLEELMNSSLLPHNLVLMFYYIIYECIINTDDYNKLTFFLPLLPACRSAPMMIIQVSFLMIEYMIT